MSNAVTALPVAVKQNGTFHMDWSSKDRVLWGAKKLAAYEALVEAVNEARRQARVTELAMLVAQQNLQSAKTVSIHVARVTVQKREDTPNFHRLYDLPFEKQELTDHTGHVFTYDRTKYRELSRKDNPHWKAQVAEARQRIEGMGQLAQEAEDAHRAARDALNEAAEKVQAFK